MKRKSIVIPGLLALLLLAGCGLVDSNTEPTIETEPVIQDFPIHWVDPEERWPATPKAVPFPPPQREAVFSSLCMKARW